MVSHHLQATSYKEHTGSQMETKLIKRGNESARYGRPQERVIGRLRLRLPPNCSRCCSLIAAAVSLRTP